MLHNPGSLVAFTGLVLVFGYLIIATFSALAFRAGRKLGRMESMAPLDEDKPHQK